MKPVVTLLWLLLAHVVYFNIMIAIVGDVYGQTKERWSQGELEMKNEFVVSAEKLLFWRRCCFSKKCISENNIRHHLIFVQADEKVDEFPMGVKIDKLDG